MYRHHIENMAEGVAKALGLSDEQKTVAREALAKHWTGQIAVVWATADIIDYFEEECEEVLSEEDAQELLDYSLRKYDATRGLNWEVFESNWYWLKMNKERVEKS